MSYSYKSHGDLIERAVLEQMDRRSAAFKAAWTGGAMRCDWTWYAEMGAPLGTLTKGRNFWYAFETRTTVN